MSAYDVRDTVIEELPASRGSEVVVPKGSGVAVLQELHALREIGILPASIKVSAGLQAG